MLSEGTQMFQNKTLLWEIKYYCTNKKKIDIFIKIVQIHIKKIIQVKKQIRKQRKKICKWCVG